MTQLLDDLCAFLEWDTKFFNRRIARVIPNVMTHLQAQKIHEWCIKNDIECIYFLANSNDMATVRVAEDNHYRQVDVRVTYEVLLNNVNLNARLNSPFILDDVSHLDIDDMLDMIDNAFEHTRFYFDPNFSEEQCNNLYKTWLIRSIEEDFADRVFVIRKDGQPQAFVTCQLNRETNVGSIGLIGVAEFARGQQLAPFLIDSALKYFQEIEMKRAEVVTQARNISANRLYQKCGFRTKNTYLWYHKWFN